MNIAKQIIIEYNILSKKSNIKDLLEFVILKESYINFQNNQSLKLNDRSIYTSQDNKILLMKLVEFNKKIT